MLSPLKDLIIYDTYPAREGEMFGGRAIDLYCALNTKNNMLYMDDTKSLIYYIQNNANAYNCVLILGAGDLADKLKHYYKSNKS